MKIELYLPIGQHAIDQEIDAEIQVVELIEAHALVDGILTQLTQVQCQLRHVDLDLHGVTIARFYYNVVGYRLFRFENTYPEDYAISASVRTWTTEELHRELRT